MSWLVYLLGCALVSALIIGLGVLGHALLARPVIDPERFPATAARLGELDCRGGRVWARLGQAPLLLDGGGPRGAPRHVVASVLGDGARVSTTIKLAKRWHERLAAVEGQAFEARFAAAFELEEDLGWPSEAARRGLLALIEGDPRLESVAALAEPGAVRLRITAHAVTDETLAAGLDLLEQLGELPERLQALDSPPRKHGAGVLLWAGLAWALLISTGASYQAALVERTAGTVIARDESPAASEARLIVALDDGRERPVWVPSDFYLGCGPGQRLVREPLSVVVSCDETRSLHLALVAQIPLLVMMWLAATIGLLGMLELRAEAAHRRSL